MMKASHASNNTTKQTISRSLSTTLLTFSQSEFNALSLNTFNICWATTNVSLFDKTHTKQSINLIDVLCNYSNSRFFDKN